MSKFKLIFVILLIGTISPILIGISSGMFLQNAADGNETYEFARDAYLNSIANDNEFQSKRNKFSRTEINKYGQKHSDPLCKEVISLADSRISYNKHLSIAIATNYPAKFTSDILEHKYDEPAVREIESLSTPIIGGFKGCKYTIANSICRYYISSVAKTSINKEIMRLKNERNKIVASHVQAVCFITKAIKPELLKK